MAVLVKVTKQKISLASCGITYVLVHIPINVLVRDTFLN